MRHTRAHATMILLVQAGMVVLLALVSSTKDTVRRVSAPRFLELNARLAIIS